LISAILVALREGVEAALVVGIVLVYLNRTGRRALKGYVWTGVSLACLTSIGLAVALQSLNISEDGFEGLMMLVASALVVTMIIWMNHVARSLRKEIEQRIEAYAQKSTRAAGWGVAAFVFMMVVREGAELVLILRAVEISSQGVLVWIGTGIGIAIAVAVGIFFFQGTLKIPLHRFFTVTSVILVVVAFQLALTGIHELSEAEWIWSGKLEMATIGPIVANEFFFFAVILGAAALAVFREWQSSKKPKDDATQNAAEKRLREYEFKRQRRWSLLAATLYVAIVLMLGAEFVYAQAMNEPSAAAAVAAQNGEVQIPVAQLADSTLHFYSADIGNTTVRFMVVHEATGQYVTALDACEICGSKGYKQEGQNVICRNCGAVIYIPSIGQKGGCNPIPVKSRVEGETVIVNLSDLAGSAKLIHS